MATPSKRRRTCELYIVGSGDCGQLGHGDEILEFQRPRKFAFFSDKCIAQVACGGMHTVAVSANGQVWTWGCNDDAALGREGPEDRPIQVTTGAFGKERILSACAGDSHTLALTQEGRVWGWGTYKDSNGTIGFSASLREAHEPVQLQLPSTRSICSGSNHSMAVTIHDTVYAWGCGEQHQLGFRMLPGRQPEHLQPGRNLVIKDRRNSLRVKKAFAGAYHSFIQTVDGRVWSCGLNNYGQLGVGDRQDRMLPTLVQELTSHNIEAIDGGEHHSLALTAEGRVLAWGRSDSNQLGMRGEVDDLEAEDTRAVLEPSMLPDDTLDEVNHISTSANHCAAVAKDGRLYTWGFGELYQLGHGDDADEEQPRAVEKLGNAVVDVSAGGQHTVMLVES